MTETTKSHDTRRRVIAQAQVFRFWAMRRPLAALGVLLGAGLLLGAGGRSVVGMAEVEAMQASCAGNGWPPAT